MARRRSRPCARSPAAEARPRPVPRARGVRPVRLRARRRHPAHAGARRALGRSPQPAGLRAVAGRGAGRGHLRRQPGLPRRASRSRTCGRSTTACATSCATTARTCWPTSATEARSRRRPRRGCTTRSPPTATPSSAEASLPSRRRGRGRRREACRGDPRDIKRRIDSVRNTRKITRAMELVASAKLRRAQERIEALRPYARDDAAADVDHAARRGVAPVRAAPGARGPARSPSSPSPATAAWPARSTSTSCARRWRSSASSAREGFETRVLAVGKKGIGTLKFRGCRSTRASRALGRPTAVRRRRADRRRAHRHVRKGEVNRVGSSTTPSSRRSSRRSRSSC